MLAKELGGLFIDSFVLTLASIFRRGNLGADGAKKNAGAPCDDGLRIQRGSKSRRVNTTITALRTTAGQGNLVRMAGKSHKYSVFDASNCPILTLCGEASTELRVSDVSENGRIQAIGLTIVRIQSVRFALKAADWPSEILKRTRNENPKIRFSGKVDLHCDELHRDRIPDRSDSQLQIRESLYSDMDQVYDRRNNELGKQAVLAQSAYRFADDQVRGQFGRIKGLLVDHTDQHT